MCSAYSCPVYPLSSRIQRATTADQVDMPPRQNLGRRHFRTHFRTAWNPVRKCLSAAPGMCSASRCPGCRSSRRIPQATTADQVDMPPRPNLECRHFRTHFRTAWNPVRKCLTAAPGMCSACRCPGCRSSNTIPQATTADRRTCHPGRILSAAMLRHTSEPLRRDTPNSITRNVKCLQMSGLGFLLRGSV
jgi:hypothetical protein